MSHRLEEQLRDAPLPGADAAMERSRRVVLAAHATRPQRRRRLAPALAAAATALATGTLALTPPGAAVADWVGDVIKPGEDKAAPVLQTLPSPGRLLVDATGGPWIVHADGTKRRLGDYQSASWSPRGLYLAVTRELELLAVDPEGQVRWSLPADAPVTAARWAPNGLRIAYLSGSDLRLVDGNGTDDERLVADISPVAPAWRPSAPQELAYVDARGAIRVIEPESRRARWRSRQSDPPVQLAWTSDGRHLLARAARRIRIFDSAGKLVQAIEMPAGARAMDAAWAPDGERITVLRHIAGTGRSDVVVVSLDGNERRLFAGHGRFTSAAWSPDGHWLALAWPDADQWLFVRTGRRQGIAAAGDISDQFASGPGSGFPDVVDWCCTPGS